MAGQQRVRGEQTESGKQLKRRGLIAGVAALVAAGLAKLAGPGRAEATHAAGGTPNADSLALHVGQTNASTGLTTLSGTGSGHSVIHFIIDNVNDPGADALHGHASSGIGLRGDSSSNVGVRGNSNSSSGVVGVSQPSAVGVANPPTPAGVYGVSSFNTAVRGDSGSNVGVFGSSDSSSGVIGSSNSDPGVTGISTSDAGVLGVSGSGPGVVGQITNFSNSNPGVQGTSASGFGVRGSSTNNIGILGEATAGNNFSPGVFGSATQGYGVFGFSANSNGIAGQSGTSAAGCVGFAGAPGGYGIFGGIAVQGGFAGGFAGPVLVAGDFTVSGGSKSAAVPHPDGTHRRLYCQESPEAWFEDFGRGRLVNGRAEVKLDPDFLAVVKVDDYYVFPIPEGDSNGLYVSSLSPSGFEVREQKGGTSSLSFSYRVVAKRKDIPGPRLERIKLPEPIKELKRPPEPPRLPEPVAPPAEPDRPGR